MKPSVYMPQDELVAKAQALASTHGYEVIASLYRARGYTHVTQPGPERWRSVLVGVEDDAIRLARSHR